MRAKINFNALNFVIGPALFFLLLSLPIEGLSYEGKAVLACTAWIAYWWITETVEIVITSLLPLVIFPLSGAIPISDTANSYGNPFIYLFLGGFIIGLAVEEWNLHKRIAFNIIKVIGSNERMLLLGVMIATAFLSMWISNTATAIMMLPVGLSIVKHFESKQPFSKSILLGIAYAASIGGMATLIGTPPNLILAGVIKESLGVEISFLDWLLFAFPLATILLVITWLFLVRKIKNSTANYQLETPEKMTLAEKRVLAIVGFTAFMWITRSFIWNRWLPELDDTVIAMTGALLLFVTPSGLKNERLMDWNKAKNIPWNVLILFGAGLVIAKGFSATDLTVWLGDYFAKLDFVPIALVVILILMSINFLTEITSNTATASILLPLLITLSISLNIDTMSLLAGAAMSASCAFMLPVATPPNAIVFSSGKLTINDMMKAGVLLNLTSTLLVYLFIRFVWGLIF